MQSLFYSVWNRTHPRSVRGGRAETRSGGAAVVSVAYQPCFVTGETAQNAFEILTYCTRSRWIRNFPRARLRTGSQNGNAQTIEGIPPERNSDQIALLVNRTPTRTSFTTQFSPHVVFSARACCLLAHL